MSNLFSRLGSLARSARQGSTPWSVVSVVYGGLVFYFVGTLFESQSRYAVLFVGASVIVVALSQSLKGKSFYGLGRKGNNVVIATIIAMAIAVTVYVYTQYLELTIARAAVKSLPDHIIGIILLFLILETSRKAMGLVIPMLVLILWLYAYFGPYFPGELGHRGLSLLRIVEVSSINLDAIFGSLTGIVGTVVAIFVFYASFVRAFGGMELVFRLGRFLVRKSDYLIPQVAVVASALFGMITGSAVANVAATGPFTIPLMKRNGISPYVAGAVESCASTGGQIMPPIMASAVFVMMNYLNRSYLDIMVIGIIPALIFYLSLALGIHIRCRGMFMRRGEQTAPQEAPPASATLGRMSEPPVYKVIPILISMSVLFVLMGYIRFEVLTAAFYTVLSYLGSELVIQIVVAKGIIRGLVAFFRGVVGGFNEGAPTVAMIGVLIACIGIVVKILAVTTLAQKISFAMVDMGGDNLLVLLLMITVVCLVFGLVMSSLAAYILVAMLGAPALLAHGVNPIVAHYFVFYLAILAAITPPVAPACIVAGRIAAANYIRVSWESMKLGISLFVLPFVFIAYPALLVHSITETPAAVAWSLLAMLSITSGLCLPSNERLVVPRKLAYLCLGALLLLHPGTIVTVAVGALIMGVVFFEVRTSGRYFLRFTGPPILPPR